MASFSSNSQKRKMPKFQFPATVSCRRCHCIATPELIDYTDGYAVYKCDACGFHTTLYRTEENDAKTTEGQGL